MDSGNNSASDDISCVSSNDVSAQQDNVNNEDDKNSSSEINVVADSSGSIGNRSAIDDIFVQQNGDRSSGSIELSF